MIIFSQEVQAEQDRPQHVLLSAWCRPVHHLGGDLRPLLRHQQTAFPQ